MTSSESIKLIAKGSDMPANYVVIVFDALTNLLKETVHDKGEVVSIAGLGTFSRKGYPNKYRIEFKSAIKSGDEETGV